MKLLKSIFSIFVLLAFLLSTIGIQLNKHYCGGLLAGINLYFPAPSCSDLGEGSSCSKESMEMSCCDDEVEFHQLDLELFHSTGKVEQFSKVSSFDFTPFQTDFSTLFEGNNDEGVHILERPPPELSSIPLFKKHHQFIFYG